MKTEITKKLNQMNIDYKVKHHSQAVYTSEDAARERGVSLSQIVKTILLIDKNGQISVAVLPGNRRLALKRVKKLLGVKDLSFVDRETVEQRLGLVAGAISPTAAHFDGMQIFVDPSVFYEKIVDISSGDPQAGLELKSDDLKMLLKDANFEAITEDPE